MAKVICPEPGSQLTIGSTTAPNLLPESPPTSTTELADELEAMRPRYIDAIVGNRVEYPATELDALLARAAAALRQHGRNMIEEATAQKKLKDRATKAEAALVDYQSKHTAIMKEADRRYEEQTAELAKARKDAERYRWLRGHHQSDIKHRLVWYLPRTESLDEQGLDAAIDAALEQGGEG
jgi:hypothetical protein